MIGVTEPLHACCKHGLLSRCFATYAVLILLCACHLPATVSADQIVTADTHFQQAKILSFQDGNLRFRAADNSIHERWIGDIRQIVVDSLSHFHEFNEAERHVLQQEPSRALPKYERTARIARDFWIDLIRVRLMMAANAADDIQASVQNWIRVLRGRWSGIKVASVLLPTTSATVKKEDAFRAASTIAAAREASEDDTERALLLGIEFGIFASLGDERTVDAAARLVDTYIPKEVRTSEFYRYVNEAFSVLLTGDNAARWLNHLDRAIGEAPDSAAPTLLLRKGDVLLQLALTPDEVVKAGWCYMRVVAHFAEDERAARGLYGAATVMKRLGKMDKAKQLANECLAHPAALPDVREKAGQLLQSLASG